MEKSLYSSESEAMEVMRNVRILEKQKLAEEISKLKSIRDLAINDTKSIMLGVEDADKKVTELKNQIIILENIITTNSQETREFINHCIAVLKNSEEKLRLMIDISKEMEQRVIKATEKLAITQNEAKIIHETVVKEGELMDRQKNDLNIYHERLKAYFKEHLPDQKIVI